VHDGFVMARPCDHRPSVSRGMIVSRKVRFFPAFQILFEQTSKAGEHVLQ